MQEPQQQTIQIRHSSNISKARRSAKAMATEMGFDDKTSEEIVLAVSELASNLVNHTRGGTLKLTPVRKGEHVGIEVESMDQGPGIPNIENAITDGVSTVGSLGYGLGVVNRMMDEFSITSRLEKEIGTHITCRRWMRQEKCGVMPCPLTFGVATRAHPRMKVNGDAFVIKQWGESSLVSVIDGLGHGELAHRAAQTARQYVEAHFDQPFKEIFRGVGQVCRSTRGVVMALARFDWAHARLTFASVGNVEARVLGASQPPNFVYRRGIVGRNTLHPVVTEQFWEPSNVMVLYSDGLAPRWKWEDFPHLRRKSATAIAQQLLRTLAKERDDATVIVVRDAS